MEKAGLKAKTPQEYRSRSEPRSSTESRESRNSKNRTRSCNPSRKSGQSADANSYGGSNSSSSQSKSIYLPNQISSSCTDSCSDHKVLSSSHHIQLPINEPSNTNIEVPLRKNVIRISRKSFGNKCVLQEIDDVSTKQDEKDIPDVKRKRSPSAKTKSSKTSIINSSDSLSGNKKSESQGRNGANTSSNGNNNTLCHCTHPSISSKRGSHTKNSDSNNRIRSSSQNSHRTSRSRSVSIGRTKQVSFSPSCETSGPNSRQSSRDFVNDRGGLEKGVLSGASSSSNTMTSKLSQFLNYIKVFRSSSPAAPQRRVGYEYLMTYVDDSVYEHIFSYLTHEELQQCSYVCKLWMKIVMPKLGGIVYFNGKTFLWSSESRSKKRIEKFLRRIRYNEEKFRHPCKIKFVNVKNDQMKYLIDTEYSDSLRMSVRNMTHINFNNCRIKWSTLVDLLLHFENLKVLTDENSYHYSFQNRLFRLPETQTHISKAVGRNIFHENGLTKVKNIKITRKTFDQEFINYILLLRATIHNLHEFSLVIIGPCEKSCKNPLFAAANERDMTEFTINLRLFLISQGRHLRKIFFKCSSEMYTDLFAKCMETLKLPNHFYALSELTLTFDRKSMKMPKNLDILMNFLKIHCAKALRMFRCSVIVLGTHWNEMVDQMETLIKQKSFTTHFELGVELCDGFGQSVTKANKKNLGLSLFVDYLTHVNIYVENEKTCSIKEMMPQESTKQYLRVKKFNVKFAPGGKYPIFKDFKMDSIAHNFPNLHELFIQDEIEGNKEQSSGATLGDPEIQLISAVLVNLRVLRIWTNLESLTDYGITGICPEEIYSLQTKRTRSSNGVEHDLRSSFSSLSDIRELSLRGVGKGVTSISARFGFENLPKLQYLEIIGAHKIGRSGKKVLQKKLTSNNPECILKLYS